MVFGIDLGTTNSLIGTGNTLLTGLVSSNVNVSTKAQVSRDEIGEDIVSSYKTDMSMSEGGKLSIACSTVILKELAAMASRRYGEKVNDVIISVPAYFSTSQREAVYKAAEGAGLVVKTLINEPTAAALYVCRDMKDLVVVYDLGGGTFDVSVVDSRLGNYSVIATDGLVLGGDDLDCALAEEAMRQKGVQIRYKTSQNVKRLVRDMRLAKEEIQKDGVTQVEVDMSVFKKDSFLLTESFYRDIVRKVFYPTIVKTQNIIGMNLPTYEKPKMVFVGGSSSCPYLKEMLREEIGIEEIKCSANPDYIVAMGVALYAGLYADGRIKGVLDDVTKRLCIGDSSGGTLTVIEKNTSVPCKAAITVKNHTKSASLRLRLYQGDSAIAEKNDYIGMLVYYYDDVMEAEEGIVEVEVNVSEDGVVSLSALEVLYGEPSRQSITLTAR